MHKILLIEDDETMLSLIQTLLEIEGFKVVGLDCLDDIEEILKIMSREQPSLVLLDVHLRCFNGFDLLSRIRQDETLKDVRVLMSSGMELSYECGQRGADGFILKPYMPDELVGKIRNTLGN
jgi:DNA-binding response OmpR family regulator